MATEKRKGSKELQISLSYKERGRGSREIDKKVKDTFGKECAQREEKKHVLRKSSTLSALGTEKRRLRVRERVEGVPARLGRRSQWQCP